MQRNFGSPGLAVRPDDPGPAEDHFKRIAQSGAIGAARRRRRQLAAIHVAAKALGLEEETYRDMLEGLTGKRS